MNVLRMQQEDTSALLRPVPRPSDRLRKLVDVRVKRTLEKLRALGATGTLHAAIWVPRKEEKIEREVAGSPVRKTRGGRKA